MRASTSYWTDYLDGRWSGLGHDRWSSASASEPSAASSYDAGFSPMRTLPELLAPRAGTGLGEANGAGRTELIDQYYDTVQGRYEFSGNQDIDGVLIGSRWTIRSFTFSFPGSGTFYSDQGYEAGTEPSAHTPFNAQQREAVRYAYSLIASYTGLTFTEVTETATAHADFRFSQTGATDDVPSALANFPSSSPRAGDVWFGTSDQPFYSTPAIGNWGMATILHEMGHTMGLKHGHSDYTKESVVGSIDAPPGGGERYGSAALPLHHDGQDWAVMSYRSDPTAPDDNPAFAGDGFNQPQTYMQNDIAALQYLYGANFNHNADNTVYSWNPDTGTPSINGVVQGAPTSNKISMTVWDGNGIDTYDLSNYDTDLRVDLRPGAFSTFSYDQLVNHQAENGDGDDLTSGGAISVGNVANALLYRNNPKSLIENATGGTGNDHMVGNQASNTLRGGVGGDDLLVGDAGSDVLYGGAGSDKLYGDGAPALASGVGMGSGAVTKHPGGGNYSLATAYDVTNLFSLASNANIEDATTVPHVTITGNGDYNFDYYKVTVTAGTTLTFDIDNTFALDTIILLYDVAGNRLAFNDDGSITQGAEGSIFPQDSYLTFTVTRTGTYYLQVAEYLGSNQIQGPGEFTSYQLHISATGREAAGSGNGHDLLDGGLGADTMVGGLGDDTYVVDQAGDKVVEGAAAGRDTVESLITYKLGLELEDLVLSGASATSGTGNSAANRITGNAAANRLTGLDGNDTLDGGGGADTMIGGNGNDAFVVDDARDKASEAANGGIDTVRSSVSFTLGAELERLVLTGGAAINGTGNGLANSITGNAAANALSGGDGSDMLNGGGGLDRMSGGLGDDSYVVDASGDKAIETSAAGGTDTVRSTASFTLGNHLEKLILAGTAAIDGTGNALANSISGNAAANKLNGGAGADRLTGGLGDDNYVVDSANDVAIETSAAGGTDIVRSTASFTLGNHVEKLILGGTAAIDGIGNATANFILGNAAANVINGKGGNDTLSGGAGDDSFLFDTRLSSVNNLDEILDFAAADDTIHLDRSIFTGIASNGALSAAAFVNGTAAKDANDRIIYNKANGDIYYDADGSGAGGKILFARVDDGIVLTNADFVGVG
jgi:serralysin